MRAREAGIRIGLLDAGPLDAITNTHSVGAVRDALISYEAAIVNALLAAETMFGRDGNAAYRLDHARLFEILARYGRPARPAG